MVVVHRILWWRLRSANHVWTRRWLRSPSLEALSWTMGALEVSCCDHCRGCSAVSLPQEVSFWHRASSKLAAALWTETRHFGLSMAYPSRSLGLMWHHLRLALTVSLYRSFGLPWLLLLAWSSPYIRRLGIWHSSIRITCPTHRSWALMMVASILGDLVDRGPSD